MNQSQQFLKALQSGQSNVIYEALMNVILSDDLLDDKTRVQKLVDLIHSYEKVKTELT